MEIPSEFIYPLIILLLIFFSGFFSGSETALTALSRAKIHKLMQQGSRKAKYVEKLRRKKDRLIGSILVGNNLVNIFASALATQYAIQHFGENSVYISTLIMTVLVVIFAEILPKTYALYNAEKLALALVIPLKFFVKILSPFAIVMQYIVERTLNIFGFSKQARQNDLISAIEELRGSIELHYREGSVVKQDKDMLDSILDLAETEVAAVMTHRKKLFMVNAAEPSKKIIEAISKCPYTRVPLWLDEKDNIIGVLHAKDILKTITHSTKKTTDLDFSKIASEPWFIPENTTLREQLFAFKKERSHFAIVVDEYGSVMGIITLEDILEEIVGEIKDEHDKGAINNYKKINKNSFIVEGSAAIRDINRDLDLSFPEDEASTIAGLLINLCERIPERGEEFSFLDFTFIVLEKHKNQITKIKLLREKASSPSPDEG